MKSARDAVRRCLLEIFENQAAFVQTSTKKSLLKHKSKLDINQKVYVENAPVLGDGGKEFTDAHVANEAVPIVKVLRGRRVDSPAFRFTCI